MELRYRSPSVTQSLSPSTTMRLSRKGVNPAGVPSFLIKIPVFLLGAMFSCFWSGVGLLVMGLVLVLDLVLDWAWFCGVSSCSGLGF